MTPKSLILMAVLLAGCRPEPGLSEYAKNRLRIEKERAGTVVTDNKFNFPPHAIIEGNVYVGPGGLTIKLAPGTTIYRFETSQGAVMSSKSTPLLVLRSPARMSGMIVDCDPLPKLSKGHKYIMNDSKENDEN